jgi:predicted acetyltransferase
MDRSEFRIGGLETELQAYASIAAESLRVVGGTKPWIVYIERVGKENLRGIYAGDVMIGGLAIYRTAHWFGGREIAAGGISGVAISPGDRGRGGCRQLLRAVLEELRGDSVPLASLYASTQYLYRTVGFEHAGMQTGYSIPISSIRSVDRTLPCHRFADPPVELLDAVARTRARFSNGNLSRTPGLWARMLDPYDGLGTTTYLLGPLEHPQGYAILKGGSRDHGLPQPLISTDVAANTPQALRRLLALVYDHRSMCDSFEWFGPPNDPLITVADEQWVRVKEALRWMLRIVDVPAALSARGYASHVKGSLQLEIEDDLFPENSGRWRVDIGAGSADVVRGGDGALKMDIRALAPLYSAFYSAAELVQMGFVRCDDPSQVALAGAAFAGPQPWLPEIF